MYVYMCICLCTYCCESHPFTRSFLAYFLHTTPQPHHPVWARDPKAAGPRWVPNEAFMAVEPYYTLGTVIGAHAREEKRQAEEQQKRRGDFFFSPVMVEGRERNGKRQQQEFGGEGGANEEGGGIGPRSGPLHLPTHDQPPPLTTTPTPYHPPTHPPPSPITATPYVRHPYRAAPPLGPAGRLGALRGLRPRPQQVPHGHPPRLLQQGKVHP